MCWYNKYSISDSIFEMWYESISLHVKDHRSNIESIVNGLLGKFLEHSVLFKSKKKNYQRPLFNKVFLYNFSIEYPPPLSHLKYYRWYDNQNASRIKMAKANIRNRNCRKKKYYVDCRTIRDNRSFFHFVIFYCHHLCLCLRCTFCDLTYKVMKCVYFIILER